MKYLIIIIFVLLASPVFALYDQPYIEYDNDGITQINCIRCNVPVKTRALEKRDHPELGEIYIYAFRTLNQMHQISFDLSDGSYTNLYICTDCKREYTDSQEELDGMTRQFQSGFEIEAMAAKKSAGHIKKVKKRYKDKKVKKVHARGGKNK